MTTKKTASPKVGFDPEQAAKTGAALGFSERDIESHLTRLAALVPPEWKAERYVHRLLAGKEDFERFDLARKTRHNLMMPGPTGAGKTTAAIAYAAYHRMAYGGVEFDGGFSFADVIGSTKWGEDGKPHYVLGVGALIIGYGGVWDLADCNLAPPKFMSPMFPVLDQRQHLPIPEAGLVIPKHPNCVVFGSYNPGYIGTSRLNEAFINRFGLPHYWGYDDGVEEALIGSRSPALLQCVRRLRADDNIRTDIGTNVMEEFITFATHDDGDLDIAVAAMTYRFPEEEQEIVQRALEALSFTIASELGVAEDDYEEDFDEATADEAEL